MLKSNNAILASARSVNESGPSFGMNHRYADNTHSNEKNGGSKASPLEKAVPKEKPSKDDKSDIFV